MGRSEKGVEDVAVASDSFFGWLVGKVDPRVGSGGDIRMTGRKNLLFLAHRVPFPPDKGDKIRTFHQLDQLSLMHNVYCACFVESSQDAHHAKQLRRWCDGVIAVQWRPRTAMRKSLFAVARGRSFTEAAYRDFSMKKRLSQLCKTVNMDIVVAFSSCMAQYALKVPAKRRVLDMCDVDSEKWLGYAKGAGFMTARLYEREGRLLRAFEKECLKRFDATILITDRERTTLDPQGDCSNLHVVSNGVTLRVPPPVTASHCGPIATFVGAMDYRPNVEGVERFVRKTWPLVLAEIPDAQFLIVGRHPVRRVQRLARVKGVTVTGEVHDPRIHLARSRVVVVPLDISCGLQNKVLEAMAMRRPVVTTSAVANGLKVESGTHLMVTDAPEAFAAKIMDLCRSGKLCDKIADSGYRCAATHYGWGEALQRYEDIVLGLPVAQLPAEQSLAVESSLSPVEDIVLQKEPSIEEQRARVSRGRSPYAAMMRGDVVSLPGGETTLTE